MAEVAWVRDGLRAWRGLPATVSGGGPHALKLVDSKVSTTGVVIGTYEPAGEIVTGSFALD